MQLRNAAEDLESRNTQILVVVPHDQERIGPWQERAGPSMKVLADPGFVASCKYGVAFQMRIHTDTSNTPGCYVVSEDGEVVWSQRGEGRRNFRDRAELSDLLEALDGISAPEPVSAPLELEAVVVGTPLEHAGLEGKLRERGAAWTVATIYAPDCGGCLGEALALQERRAAWAARGIDLFGLGWAESGEDCRRFHRQSGGRVHFPLYQAEWALDHYEIDLTPALLLFDAEGALIRKVGALDSEHPLEEIERELKTRGALALR